MDLNKLAKEYFEDIAKRVKEIQDYEKKHGPSKAALRIREAFRKAAEFDRMLNENAPKFEVPRVKEKCPQCGGRYGHCSCD